MRIVTRPDFDGIVCAVLLYESEKIDDKTYWIQPGELKKGHVEIRSGDIMANLPYDPRCSMWFDHHYTNRIDAPFAGSFKIEPSAARVIYDYYREQLGNRFDELVRQTDKVDSADLTRDEVIYPEKYPYVLLSMTISGNQSAGASYWNHLVELLRKGSIAEVMADSQVRERCRVAIEQNKEFKELLAEYTHVKAHVAVTDFRPLGDDPTGNRFLVYSMFPETVVSIKIRYAGQERENVRLSVGHSIFNRNCHVNVGLLLAQFGGGGHRGAGGCTFPTRKADDYLPKIIQALVDNQDNEE